MMMMMVVMMMKRRRGWEVASKTDVHASMFIVSNSANSLSVQLIVPTFTLGSHFK